MVHLLRSGIPGALEGRPTGLIRQPIGALVAERQLCRVSLCQRRSLSKVTHECFLGSQ